jgi:hypothetical protein
MWWLLTIVLASAIAWQWWRVGPREALGVGVLGSYLLPTWIRLDIPGLPIDLHTTAAFLGLLAYCGHRQATFRVRLVAGDWALLSLVTVHLVSDNWNEGLSIFHLVRAYGEWILPYLAGRQAVQCLADLVLLRKTYPLSERHPCSP